MSRYSRDDSRCVILPGRPVRRVYVGKATGVLATPTVGGGDSLAASVDSPHAFVLCACVRTLCFVWLRSKPWWVSRDSGGGDYSVGRDRNGGGGYRYGGGRDDGDGYGGDRNRDYGGGNGGVRGDDHRYVSFPWIPIRR
jgi:hypothetical protein